MAIRSPGAFSGLPPRSRSLNSQRGGLRAHFRFELDKPQDNVAQALVGPAHRRQSIHNGRLDPDQTLAFRSTFGSKPTLPSGSVAAIASNAAGVMEIRIKLWNPWRAPPWRAELAPMQRRAEEQGERLCRFGYAAVLLFALRHDPEPVIRQGPLQRERVNSLSVKPSVDLVRRRQDDRHGFRMDGGDDGVGFSRQEAEEFMDALDGRALRAAHASQGAQRPAKAKSGRSSLSANQIGVLRGLVSKYSQNDVAGTMQRFLLPSHPRQCGLATLRMLVTGWPPY